MLNDFDLGTMSGQGFNVLAPEVETVQVQTEMPARDNDHFFDFEKAKVQSLTLEQLKRTVRENDVENGKPLHGIQHYELIDRLTEVCLELGYQAEIYDMFATNNKDRLTPGVSLYPELEQRYGKRAVEAHSIRRIYTNLRIRNFDTDELTTNLAVSYTQKGIQIGIGRNVKICHNQCMLSAERYIADFSTGNNKGDRIPTADLLGRVKVWLEDLHRIVDEDDLLIGKMKATAMTPAQVLLVIGMLTAARVQHDTEVKRIKVRSVYPLNQAQIGRFTERLLTTQHDEGRITAWDMYNAATDLYKPQTAEQTLILPQNLSFVKFMRQNAII